MAHLFCRPHEWSMTCLGVHWSFFSAWSILILNLSSQFFSCYFVLHCHQFCLVLFNFFLSLLKFLHCSCIVLLTLVRIFMTFILNSLSGESYNCFIKVHFWRFILFFCSEYLCLVLHFPWLCWCPTLDKAGTSCNLCGLVMYRRTPPMNTAKDSGGLYQLLPSPERSRQLWFPSIHSVLSRRGGYGVS